MTTMMDYLNGMSEALSDLPGAARNALLANTLYKFNEHTDTCTECSEDDDGTYCTWADGMYTGFTLALNMDRLNEIAQLNDSEL